MNQFELHFSDNFFLTFDVYETSIATRWFDCLSIQCLRDNQIKEKNRLYNFPDSKWTEEEIVNEINRSIQIINEHGQVIFHQAYIGMPQENLNHLHHYFEKLRGGVLSPGEYWNNSAKSQRDALEYYNVLIHRAENFYKSYGKKNPRVVCTFNDRQRYNMLDEDYSLCTLTRNFGEVYINYCEVGKPLYDVFKDGDEIIGDDNIRPLKYYSADFTVAFHDRSQEKVDKFLSRMNEWWDSNVQHLSELGFTKGDPKNALGYIPVARLNTDLSNDQIIQAITNHPTLDRVEIV